MMDKAKVVEVINEWIKDYQHSIKIADRFGIDKARVIEESRHEIGELEFMKSLVVRFGEATKNDLPNPLAQLRKYAEQCAVLTPVESIRNEALFVVKWCDSQSITS